MDVDFAELPSLVGRTFGPGRWVSIDQALIDSFSDTTGDHAWYHVDTEQAAAELPGGTTLAHGFLTLALVPGLSNELLRIRYRSRALNYGAERVRFPSPVHAGDRIRLRTTPIALTEHAQGTMLHLEHVVETDHSNKPALVFVRLSLVLGERIGSDYWRQGATCPAPDQRCPNSSTETPFSARY